MPYNMELCATLSQPFETFLECFSKTLVQNRSKLIKNWSNSVKNRPKSAKIGQKSFLTDFSWSWHRADHFEYPHAYFWKNRIFPDNRYPDRKNKAIFEFRGLCSTTVRIFLVTVRIFLVTVTIFLVTVRITSVRAGRRGIYGWASLLFYSNLRIWSS